MHLANGNSDDDPGPRALAVAEPELAVVDAALVSPPVVVMWPPELPPQAVANVALRSAAAARARRAPVRRIGPTRSRMSSHFLGYCSRRIRFYAQGGFRPVSLLLAAEPSGKNQDVTDWHKWHTRYDDPESSLARRLEVVLRRVSEALSAPSTARPARVLSLCSGDGRDLLPVLAHSEAEVASALLVEQDARLAQTARATAAELGLDQVTVLVADAGETERIKSAVPVDLLLLCGIFGNIPVGEIARTVAASPAMLRPGGTVIWTRGSTEPDLRPTIRRWFVESGLRETAFDGEPSGFGGGVATKPSQVSKCQPLPGRLFTFIR
jgi:hypothetical protein